MNISNKQQVIGTTETINIIEANISGIPTKVDTGAFYSSIWASKIKERDEVLSFVLFDEDSPYYSGETLNFKKYFQTTIRNSFGQAEERYRVKLTIVFGDHKFKTDFTLANRSINRYPVLLGRSLLHNRFIVDVTKNDVHYNKAIQI
ncbi:MAG: RimK/LysX family protein [Candidatus Saccharibacteria bacterium]